MQEEDGLTFQQIGDRLEKRLASLIEEGTYKIENPSFGKAFPVMEEEEDKNNKKKSNKRGRDDNEDEQQNDGGHIFMSKNALKRFKTKERKKIAAEVHAANAGQWGDKNKKDGKSGKGSGKGGKGKGGPTCWICGKQGHKADACWQNPKNKGSGKGNGSRGDDNSMLNMSQLKQMMEMMKNMNNNRSG